ncbi:MAG: hypothetical protein RJA81_1759, partial [Planctomycetota bacterium]
FGQPSFPHGLINGDLPNEKRVMTLRRAVSRDESDDLTVLLSHKACIGEIPAQQQIQVAGIDIENL